MMDRQVSLPPQTGVELRNMNRALGITFIIISAASFATLAIFGRYAYADGLDTFTLLFLRFTFSAPGFAREEGDKLVLRGIYP